VIVLSLGDVLLRLTVALLLGAGVGIERERTGHSSHAAGMRTLALVSMGSALFMIISAYGFTAFTSAAYAKVDPSRIAAQIVSGIGFIGAGAILLQRQAVRGLTTAAAVWVMAAIGMACGLGLILQAVSATALGLIVLALLRPLEQLLFHKSKQIPQRVLLSVAREAEGDVLRDVHALWDEAHLTLDSIEMRPGTRGDVVEIRCRGASTKDLVDVTGRLRKLPYVRAVQVSLSAPTRTIAVRKKHRADADASAEG
jgi:putative Mg2+ transporter-C (MgtC) family protein